MLKFTAALFAILSLTSPAFASDPQILGRWISTRPVFDNGLAIVKLGFDFKEDSADMSTICYYPNNLLEAIVTVPMQVEGDKINVLSGGEKKVAAKGFECINNVAAGAVVYSIKDNVLRVRSGGQTMDFVRRQ